MDKRLVGVAAVVVVLALVVAGVLWWRGQSASAFVEAADLAPADAERLTWTDWSGVRTELGSGVDADSSREELAEMLDAGYEEDLTSTSALVGSAPEMQAAYGFSPASLDWELFSQSESGAVLLMQLPDGTDLDALRDTVEDLGYVRPDDEDGVWEGGTDLLPAIAPGLTPQLQHLAFRDDDRLVLASDQAAYLGDVLDGFGDGGAEALAEVVAAAGAEPLTAVAYDAAYACSALAMSQADAADQQIADDLLAEAGEVNPLTGFVLAELPGGGVRVAMSFESEDQARTNADSRAALLAGPAPGQGGDFTDRFAIDEVSAEGAVVTADLTPREGEYVVSDLSAGPVLFAAC